MRDFGFKYSCSKCGGKKKLMEYMLDVFAGDLWITHLAFFGFLGSNGRMLSSSQSKLKSSPRSRGTSGVR